MRLCNAEVSIYKGYGIILFSVLDDFMKPEEAKQLMEKELDLYFEERPWGSFKVFVDNKNATVKKLVVRKRLSLQYHNKRSEIWFVVKGNAIVTLGKNREDCGESVVQEGDWVAIPRKALHRVAPEKEETILIEVSLGEFDENDCVRLEDDFGRESP